MSDPLVASYDEIPFDSGAIPTSHPDALASVATVYGMSPPPADRCRVLELGCSTGGNLIGMAYSLPDSSFVGIDLSPVQIASARAMSDAVGLRNVDFRALSIVDVGDDFGTFDYIVCHGVYSWVKRDVQDALLQVCARRLASNGIAYVSYNTYPGWHVRAMVREMIVFHDDPARSPRDRVARGRAFVEFLAEHASEGDSVYRAIFARELVTLRTMSDSHFLHEELEAVNEPLWYSEFSRRAGAAGLEILAEAGLSVFDVTLSPDVSEQVQRWSADGVAFEQYLDFLRDATFRRSLLCRAGARHTMRPGAAAVPALHLTGRAVPIAPAADPLADVTEEFRSPRGHVLSTSHQLVRSALHVLHDSMPRALPFPELWREVCGRLREIPDDANGRAGVLAEAMLACATTHVVQLHVRPATCAVEAGARPMASHLARLDASNGRRITTLRHYSIELPPLEHALLPHLDGMHDRAELVEIVRGLMARGDLPFGDATPPAADAIPAALDATLRHLAARALLVA